MTAIVVSALPHTWLVDVDGTVLAHNGHLKGRDVVLPGVAAFWATIPPGLSSLIRMRSPWGRPKIAWS